MDTLLEIWGPHLNEQAMRLLQNARMVADTQQLNVNILHVLFVALTDSSLYIHRIFTEIFKKEGLLSEGSLVEDERIQRLTQEVQTQMARDALHSSLDMCKLACMETALEQDVHITDALIVAQIIEKSYSVRRVLQRERILSAMSKALHTGEKSSRSPAVKRTPSGPLNEQEVREVLENVTVLTPAREDSQGSFLTRLNEAIHRSTFDYLLRTLTHMLGESGRKILMLCGRDGSVFDQEKLEKILAYRLTSGVPAEQSAGQAQPVLLRGYQLWQLSLHTLRAMYTANPRFHPVRALDHLKQAAREQRAILLLTGLETMSARSSVDQIIKEQLTDQENTCVVGCYKYYDRPPEEQELRLGLGSNDVTILFPETEPDPVQIHQWIEEYYRQQHPGRSIHLAPDALESLLILEPGIWIYKQRKAFPSLSLEILDGCLAALDREPVHLRMQAQGALFTLQDLLDRESQETPEGVRKQFQGILRQAHERMQSLIGNPRAEIQQGKIVITRALIEAQVFSHNACEFHFPGRFPWATPRQP
jgi:hypothetical protein